ncbi:hypothetical protein MFFDBJGM_01475 [Pectobacterium versatile]|nr:hypothetical protein MFFDBJGM_01475 [Pectobacterium versatile]
MTIREEFTRIIQLVLAVETDRFESEGIKTAQLRLVKSPCHDMGGGHG